MPEPRARLLPWLAFAVLLIAVDQWSKVEVTELLDYGKPRPVFPGLNLTLLHNPGAAFSLFADGSGWQRWFFTAIAIAVSAWIVQALRAVKTGARWLPIALMLVLGGALGNLWDRLALGYVVDFIQACHGDWCFPAFNIADSAITVGAVMLVLESLFERRPDNPDADPR